MQLRKGKQKAKSKKSFRICQKKILINFVAEISFKSSANATSARVPLFRVLIDYDGHTHFASNGLHEENKRECLPWTSKSIMASGLCRSFTKQMYSAVSVDSAGWNCKLKSCGESVICWNEMQEKGIQLKFEQTVRLTYYLIYHICFSMFSFTLLK